MTALRRTERQSWPALRSIGALMLREMATTYGRSPGGWLWVVLQPVLGILLMATIFSLGFRSPALGRNFPLFFATGILPCLMFTGIGMRVAQALAYSRALLAYPRVGWLDAVIARAALALLMELAAGVAILAAIRLVWDTRSLLVVERALLAYSMAFALALGFGLLNCFLMTRFPLWQRLWQVATQPLLLLSGVLFLPESLPRPWFEALQWNPLLHATAEMRAGFYPQYPADWVSPAYVFGVALAAGLAGMLLLHRFHRDLLEL